MNYKCPHCNEPTISWWRKVNSGALFPAKCTNCNGLSIIERKSSLVWIVMLSIVTSIFILPILELGLAVFIVCILGFSFTGLHLMAKYCPLVAI